MRIVVVGTSGAGKTTLARRIAALLMLPHIELDAINWQPGWRDLTRHDPEEFVRRVDEATQAAAWVVDGITAPCATGSGTVRPTSSGSIMNAR